MTWWRKEQSLRVVMERSHDAFWGKPPNLRRRLLQVFKPGCDTRHNTYYDTIYYRPHTVDIQPL